MVDNWEAVRDGMSAQQERKAEKRLRKAEGLPPPPKASPMCDLVECLVDKAWFHALRAGDHCGVRLRTA
jgi:hypothetical protein